ncbi:MAG: hypothetical protein AAFU79_31065, partial [Myxococcota bacterium]
PFTEKARIFGRLDSQDFNRTILVVEELWAEWDLGDLEIRVGADILNWTATEAFHPADIINARNLDSDVESYEKIGEPMVALSYDVGVGNITAYFFPYYSEPIFPASSSRLAFIPPEVPVGEILRMSADGSLTDDRFGLQGAIRFIQSFGSVDLGLHVVHHLDRSQPEVLFDDSVGLPRPLFRTVTQFGGTYQHVIEGLIVKIEAGYRIFAKPENNETRFGSVEERDHLQVAVGLEYGWLVDDADVTLLLEGQAYLGVDDAVLPNLGVFQRDALFGTRISLNDTAGTELLVSGIVDLQNPDQILFNASWSRRILTGWTISAALRMAFSQTAGVSQQGFQVPPASDHARLFITRFF